VRHKQTLALTNSGQVTHNITISGAMDIDLDPGREEISDPIEAFVPQGTYTFHCKFHRNQGMHGQLQVVG